MPNTDSAPPLMVGPVSGPVSGQSVAFAEACKAIGDDAVIVDASFASIWSIPAFLWHLLFGFFRSSGPVYFTSSRSKVGFIARDLPIMFLAILSRRPLVNHLHGNDFRSFRESAGRILGALIDFCYNYIAISVVPAQALLLQYEGYPKMETIAVSNFFDESISHLPFDKAVSGTVNVIFLSNLMHSKGFLTSARAIDLLCEEGINVRLFLCGWPLADHEMSKEEVERCIEDLRGDSNIDVVGGVSGAEKFEILSKAHILVLPTTKDAAPICIIEAFAAGCCVVTTNQGAIPELVDGFHACIVEPTPAAVAAAIKSLAEKSRCRRVWDHNRSLAISRFSASEYRKGIKAVLLRAQQSKIKG